MVELVLFAALAGRRERLPATLEDLEGERVRTARCKTMIEKGDYGQANLANKLLRHQ